VHFYDICLPPCPLDGTWFSWSISLIHLSLLLALPADEGTRKRRQDSIAGSPFRFFQSEAIFLLSSIVGNTFFANPAAMQFSPLSHY